MKHRAWALLCALILTFSCLPSADALAGDTQRAADTLATLQLIQGTGDGGYGLDAPATRAQGAVLLVRLAGAEQAAVADPWFTGLRDVPAWAKEQVDYAIHQGWINPGHPLDFHPDQALTADEWCGALLQLCGFTDFAPEDAAAFAQRVGLISRPCANPLDRSALFATSLDALRFTGKGPSLLQKLVKAGLVSRAAANALGLLEPALTAREIADRHMSAVFQLDGYSEQIYIDAKTPSSNASGFFITADGLAVTNYHSIHGALEAHATLSTGESYPVEGVLWYDTGMDLAVIRVSRTSFDGKTTPAFAVLTVIGSQALQPGDTVYAIGNPLGLGLAISEGRVSALGHMVDRYTQPCIVNTADISHGSSGGALLDVQGRVVAVTTGAYINGNSMYLSVPADPILELELTGELQGLPEVRQAEKDWSND